MALAEHLLDRAEDSGFELHLYPQAHALGLQLSGREGSTTAAEDASVGVRAEETTLFQRFCAVAEACRAWLRA